MSDSHGTYFEYWSWSVDDPYKFEVTRSKVKVILAFYAKTVTAQYLEMLLSDIHSTR